MTKVTSFTVFVKAIEKTEHGGVVVEAVNGGHDGPPLTRFTLPLNEVENCFVGKRYTVTIEGDSNG